MHVSFNTDSTAARREAPGFQVLGFEPSERARKTQHRPADLEVLAVQKKQRSEGPSLEVRSTRKEQPDVNSRTISAKVAFVRDKNSQELYIQVILEVKHGTAQFKPQTGTKGIVYRNPKLGDFICFWVKQAKRRFKRGE